MKTTIEKALGAKRESKRVEFKEQFDTASKRAWCEIIKDVVALANSGGGLLLIGVDNRGHPVGTDVSCVLALDPAEVTDKMHRYVETHFSEFEIVECEKDSARLALIRVGVAQTPMAFAKPGTFSLGDGKQQTAFGQGTVYFRHGAKSEPATTQDLAQAIDRRVERIRKQWIAGVCRVVQAPLGSHVAVLPPEDQMVEVRVPMSVRIVDDPAATKYGVVDRDQTHPFRQTELIRAMRERLPGDTQFNTFDVLTIRKVHGIDAKAEFSHQPRFGSRQYSESFLA